MERFGIFFAAAALGAMFGRSTWKDRKRVRGKVVPVDASRGLTASMQRLFIALAFALATPFISQSTLAAQRAPAPSETAIKETSTHLALGGNHTCQLGPDGVVRCWGVNHRGQLGDGTKTTRLTPVPAASNDGYRFAVSAGSDHTCTLHSGGLVQCWGANTFGQLGIGTTSDLSYPSFFASGIVDAVAIASGNFYSCALLSGGQVRCWGDNSSGQLGDGTVAGRLTPVSVKGLSLVTAIAAGARHACALLANGSVSCWGQNFFGQLGDGTTVNRLTPVPAVLPLPALSIAVGSDYTCAVLVDGKARCWGFNFAGQLGDGTTTNRTTPTLVSGLSDVVALTAGDAHTCAQHAGGGVYCWGDNRFGALGDGTTVRQLEPVSVNQAFGATAVEAGVFHTCATYANGFSRCWGRNFFGQVGDGTTIDRLAPAVVRDIAGTSLAERVAVGERHSCAVRDNGTVACWGDNSLGQLGDGTTTNRLTPVTVGGQSRATLLAQARAVAAGDRHTCAHLVNSIRCWGDNSFGQLGDGTTTTSLASVAAFTSPFIEALAVGDFHNCILLGSRTVRCWGRNNAGQLGDGTATNRLTPVEVVGLTDIKAVVTGSEHSCALHGDGAVSCWGRNDRGQLGNTGPISLVPVRISGLTNIIALAAGNLHTCGLTANGFAICWGANNVGQLGNGSVQTSSLPTVARVADNAIAIAAGDFYTCALLRIGYVSCWGLNSVGQLGDGTTTNRPTPVSVLNPYTGTSPLGAVAQIATGTGTACARGTRGELQCWGWNAFGQIGNGTTVNSSRPVIVPSFTLNIDPEVSLRRNESGAIVRVQAVCDEDQRLFAAVTLTQDHVVAEGHAQGACTGRLEAYPVKVHTQRAEEFAAGTARVEAAGEIVSRGQTVQRQEWGRQVTIMPGP